MTLDLLGEGAPGGTGDVTPLAALQSYLPLLDSVAEGVLLATRDGQVVFANDVAGRIFGVPRHELLLPIDGYPARFLLRTARGEPTIPVGERALAGEVVQPVEHVIRTAQGQDRRIRTSAAPLRDDHGHVIGAVVLVGDVSAAQDEEDRARSHAQALRQAHRDRERAGADLRHTAELLELGDAFFELDRDWRVVRVNANQERLSRRPRSETVGRTFAEIWPELATPASKYWREYRRCMDERVPVQFHEYYAPLELWTGVTAYPTSAGGIAVFFRDVTALKRAEEEQARLAAIVESTDDAIISKDLQGVIRTWNAAAERLFGYAPHEAIGHPITMLLPPDRPHEEDEILRELRAGRRVEHFETRRLTKSRAVVDVSVTVSPLRDANGAIVGASKIARDITEKKRTEEALREADRRKNEFLGVLSHELRNPLAPIRTAVHLLERRPGDSAVGTRARQVIRRQTEHLARLVDDLLDVTRISRGKIQLQRAVLDLRQVVRRTCEDHRAMFDQGEVDLRLEFPAAPVWADVDATRIAQIVGNLLQNALKFTPPAGAVTVTLGSRDGQAEIRVRDTGIGMEPGGVEHLFEPFAQEERSLARTRGGLGLGLALAKGLIELHGGAITAHSEGAGRGSEFALRLPLAPAPEVASAAAQASGPAERARRVLIIEDNLDAAQTLAEVLELEGHEVHVARDGATGIKLARELRPDVVLCDIGLPDLDGYEVARRLRQDDQLRSTRLVALSGYAQAEDKLRAREAGFDAHLGKPSPMKDLDAALA